ncbi:MAG: hypothetical protein HUU16_10315 [Candidatus Omnitrophica bacterium]|nr:hypothetical protein [Candidatus Omnitrophota bacterium]
MNLTDLLPVLHGLPRSDKFRALQFLSVDLEREETAALEDGKSYPVWSPHDALDAASVLTQHLERMSGGR